MHRKSRFLFALIGLLASWTMALQAKADLIILAAPLASDPYYADVRDAIFDFHIGFARRVEVPNDVLILTDAASYDRYAEALGEEHVAIAPMDDIWARDYSLSNTNDPILFRYTAAGQRGSQGVDQSGADAVQRGFAFLAEEAGLRFSETDLLNDGGNFVDDGAGSVVLSTKFLADNGLSEAEARDLLTRRKSINHVAFIEADEQGGLEHADGVVSFIAPNTLIINAYPEDPAYMRALRADLKRGLPGVTLYEVPTPYDGSQIYDDRFGSACGIYTNALVTEAHIYLPQFGIAEDQEVLDLVRSISDKRVVPVPSGQVCHMGGGIRCLSWQLRGENVGRFLRSFD